MTPTEAQSHVRRGVLKYLTSQMSERFDTRIRVEAMKLKLALATQPKAAPEHEGRIALLFPDAVKGQETFTYCADIAAARKEAERIAKAYPSKCGQRMVLARWLEFGVASTGVQWTPVKATEKKTDRKQYLRK